VFKYSVKFSVAVNGWPRYHMAKKHCRKFKKKTYYKTKFAYKNHVQTSWNFLHVTCGCGSVLKKTYYKTKFAYKNHVQTSWNFLHVTCGCGSVLPSQRCNVLRTSGFVDDVMFSHNAANDAESIRRRYVRMRSPGGATSRWPRSRVKD